MLDLSTSKRKVYSLAAEIGAEVAVANVLLKSVIPAVTAIHRERIIQKIITHLHLLAFRVKQLEAHDIGPVVLKLDLDLIGSRRIAGSTGLTSWERSTLKEPFFWAFPLNFNTSGDGVLLKYVCPFFV